MFVESEWNWILPLGQCLWFSCVKKALSTVTFSVSYFVFFLQTHSQTHILRLKCLLFPFYSLWRVLLWILSPFSCLLYPFIPCLRCLSLLNPLHWFTRTPKRRLLTPEVCVCVCACVCVCVCVSYVGHMYDVHMLHVLSISWLHYDTYMYIHVHCTCTCIQSTWLKDMYIIHTCTCTCTCR